MVLVMQATWLKMQYGNIFGMRLHTLCNVNVTVIRVTNYSILYNTHGIPWRDDQNKNATKQFTKNNVGKAIYKCFGYLWVAPNEGRLTQNTSGCCNVVDDMTILAKT